jgi:hypothetical protein
MTEASETDDLLDTSVHLPWRHRRPESNFQQPTSVGPTDRSVRTILRVVVGIVVVVSLVAVGTSAAALEGAREQHRGVERIADGAIESGSLSSTPELEHVDLFGDSLGYQAEPYLDMFLAETHDYTVSNFTYGGTATCDWLNRMDVAAAARPQAALLVFSGNAYTPCMDGASLRSPQYYDLYAAYTKQAIAVFSAVGTHVFLIGTPVEEFSVPGWEHLNDIYRQLARANPLTVTFVNAGASVETAAGGFTWTLSCMSIEPSCGPDGINTVRSPDGIHFCPDGTRASRGVTGPCGEYSSGAFRFALAMMIAVTQYAYSTPRDK